MLVKKLFSGMYVGFVLTMILKQGDLVGFVTDLFSIVWVSLLILSLRQFSR